MKFRYIISISLLFCIFSTIKLFPINGNFSIDYDYVDNNNPHIISRDIGNIGLASFHNTYLNWLLMGNIGNINYISTFRGVYDKEKEIFFKENQFYVLSNIEPIQTNYALSPLEYSYYFVENFNLQFSGPSFMANLGDFSAAGVPLTLGSKNIRGIGAEYNYKLSKEYKIKRKEIIPLLDNLKNPYVDDKFNITEFYNKSSGKTSSYVKANGFFGLSEMRDLAFTEDTTNNDYWEASRKDEDKHKNGFRDAARSAKYTETMWGLSLLSKISYLSFGGTYAHTIQDNKNISSNSSSAGGFVMTESPYEKDNYGLKIGLDFYQETIIWDYEFSHMRKDLNTLSDAYYYQAYDKIETNTSTLKITTNIATRKVTNTNGSGIRERYSMNSSLLINSPYSQSLIYALYAQPDFEDATGPSSAENNKMAAGVNNTINISDEIGNIKINGEWSRDNIPVLKTRDQYQKIKKKAVKVSKYGSKNYIKNTKYAGNNLYKKSFTQYGSTNDTLNSIKTSLGYSKQLKPFLVNYSLGYSYDFSYHTYLSNHNVTKYKEKAISKKLYTITTNSNSITNLAYYPNNSYAYSKRYDNTLQFANIQAAMFKITPQIKHTYFYNRVEPLKTYHQGVFKIGASSRMLDNRLNITLGSKFTSKILTNNFHKFYGKEPLDDAVYDWFHKNNKKHATNILHHTSSIEASMLIGAKVLPGKFDCTFGGTYKADYDNTDSAAGSFIYSYTSQSTSNNQIITNYLTNNYKSTIVRTIDLKSSYNIYPSSRFKVTLRLNSSFKIKDYFNTPVLKPSEREIDDGKKIQRWKYVPTTSTKPGKKELNINDFKLEDYFIYSGGVSFTYLF